MNHTRNPGIAGCSLSNFSSFSFSVDTVHRYKTLLCVKNQENAIDIPFYLSGKYF